MADVQALLALNLKKYRKILRLSQAALAEEIGCSTTFIGNIEIKKRFPSPRYINRIAKALGVKPAALFAERDDPEALGSEAVVRLSDRQKRKVQLERDVLGAIAKAFSGDDG
jgi:transcriptional regulator with XRE-family HTH domain